MVEKQSKIRALKFPDNVRINPYQLLGDLNDSSILIREIFDNSRDELIASKACDTIWINNENELLVVIDNGRGISVTKSDDDPSITQLELAVGSIYAGGKYDSVEVSGGLHGVGSSAVNAVCDRFIIASKITESNWQNSNELVIEAIKNRKVDSEEKPQHLGKYLILEYAKGIKTNEWVGDHKDINKLFGEVPEWMSTYVGFTPDLTIIKSAKAPFNASWYEYTFEILRRFYNKTNIKIILNGEEMVDNYKAYKFEVQKTIQLAHPGNNKSLDIFLNFEFDSDLSNYDATGCVNMITVPYGLHLEMARWMITHNLKGMFKINHRHISEGLKFDMILLANKVGYGSQTKERLVKISDLTDDDWYQLDEEIKLIFEENYDEVSDHVKRLNEYAESLQSIATKDFIVNMVNKGVMEGSNYARSYVPEKLIDCSSENRSECELFLVEGTSAGGSFMSVRDPSTQAIMGMRGKSLNTTYKSLETIFQNQEIKDIIRSIGMGTDDYFDTSNARYSKIIIASDADFDGGHISALLLGLFCYHMSYLIEEGFIYILESPLYEQDGNLYYAGEENKLDKSRHYDRFKGLGSLESDEIRDKVLTNKDTRRLIRVTIEGLNDAIYAVGDKYFRKQLMINAGLVEPRSWEFEDIDDVNKETNE